VSEVLEYQSDDQARVARELLSIAGLMCLAQVVHAMQGGGVLVFVAGAVGLAVAICLIEKPVNAALVVLLLSLTRMILPPTDREFQEIVVPVLAILIAFRFLRRSKGERGRAPLVAMLFYVFFLIYFFYGVEGPRGFAVSGGDSTGFRARWPLIVCVVVFFGTFVSYRDVFVKRLPGLLFGFYIVVVAISSIMLLTGIEELPLFNAFSWKLIVETSGTRRFGILGVGALGLSTLVLSFPDLVQRGARLPLWILILFGILLSGGRSALMAFVGVLVLWYAVKKRRVGRALVYSVIAAVMFLSVPFSPVFNWLPQGLQRAFVVLPSELYEQESMALGDASAAQSSSWRQVIWVAALAEIVDHPIIGAGFGVPVVPDTEDQNATHDWSAYNALVTGNLHNAFFSIAYIMGIPALLVFVYWVLRLMTRVYRRIDGTVAPLQGWYLWLLLSLCGHLVQGFSGDIHTALDFTIVAALTEATLMDRRSVEGLT
jgi:O-antigen ligase